MTLQGGQQLALIDTGETEAPASTKKRRRAKPPNIRSNQLSLPRHLKIVNDDRHPDPCNSGPGVCLYLDCPDNLIAYRTHNGNLHVPGLRGAYPSMTLPIATRRWGTDGQPGFKARAMTAADEDVFLERLMWRIDYVMDLLGSTCRRDIPPQTQQETAKIWGVTRQAIQHVERGVSRNQPLRELADQSHEDPKPWRNVGRTSRRSE